jgi:hypothetical protein
MSSHVVRFLPGGQIRAIWTDNLDLRKTYCAIPRRASRVEVVEEGPHKGEFFVDMSPLGPQYQFCFTRTFCSHAEALRAEQEWLIQNWVLLQRTPN